MRIAILLSAALSLVLATACKKSSETEGSTTANEAASQGLDCDHSVKVNQKVKHAWPYPADFRNLQVVGRSKTAKLKLKPTPAAFFTATVTWKDGDVVQVLDSELRILKPRRMIAKRDIFVTRREWSQGIEVERKYLAAAKGEVGEFLFYNSRGMCLVGTENGPGWSPCTLDDSFEGLSAERPHACEQVWWVQVQPRKVDKGWMIVDGEVMKRLAPPPGAVTSTAAAQ